MEIYKNKTTGQAFIYLDEQDDGRALMITPHGDVKALEYHLFTGPLEVDTVKTLVKQGQITNRQYDIYNRYKR
jgi:hypothetical protein